LRLRISINVAYCFDENNDLAHRSAFANMPVFKLLRPTGGGEICHREKLFRRTTTLGCEQNTFGARGITRLRMMS
jgi:hypothetical protein